MITWVHAFHLPWWCVQHWVCLLGCIRMFHVISYIQCWSIPYLISMLFWVNSIQVFLLFQLIVAEFVQHHWSMMTSSEMSNWVCFRCSRIPWMMLLHCWVNSWELHFSSWSVSLCLAFLVWCDCTSLDYEQIHNSLKYLLMNLTHSVSILTRHFIISGSDCLAEILIVNWIKSAIVLQTCLSIWWLVCSISIVFSF